MLARLREQIPQLTRDVVAAEIYGVERYDASEVGARHAAQDAAQTASQAASGLATEARSAAGAAVKSVRRMPGAEQAEGQARGTVASEDDLPIANYDSLTANEVIERLPRLSQVQLGQIDGYERRHGARKTVLSRIDSLRGDQPWAGYDEQSADEVQDRLREADDDETRQVRDYERRHKARQGVLDVAERKAAAT
jgi:hypothetical protein